MTASKNYKFPSEFDPVPILNVLTGSRAHGTESPTSDIDLRTIYVQPTRVIIGIGAEQPFQRLKGIDHSAWEVHRFLKMALDNNPTILEVMLSSAEQSGTPEVAIRELFPYFLSRRRIFHCYRGNAHKQRHLAVQAQNPDRRSKCAAHYLRILFNGIELLQSGDFTVRIVDSEIGDAVMRAKQGLLSLDEVTTLGQDLEARLETAYLNSTIEEQWNLEPINELLLSLRQKYW